MRMCIPIDEDRGLGARVSGHVGRAPFHCIVDTASGRYEVIESVAHESNGSGGGCHTGERIRSYQVDSLACSQIGRKALATLEAFGIAVLAADGRTVAEVLDAARRGCLRPLVPQVCDGHGEGDSHACHAHGHGQGHSGAFSTTDRGGLQ